MGGHALSANAPIRLTTEHYARLAADCVAKLQALYPTGRVYAIESYREKPTHGDADILIAADNYDPFQAAGALGAVEVVRNGPVTSIGVIVRPEVPHRDGNVFQVDLIKSSAEEFNYSSNYFGWSDLGNLIGRIAHAGFLAHRHDGLYFYHREGDYRFRDILLTRDHDLALKYLGYDPVRFNQGFDTLEDIFNYVASSAFFNASIYLLENRNATSRVRDKKRPTYTKFLAWCEAHPELPGFVYPEDKRAWLPRIAEFFPGFQAEYDQSVADMAELRVVKAKFNGEWVSQLTGLQGKELGGLMKRFKESFESAEAQRAFVLENSPDVIEARVRAVLAG